MCVLVFFATVRLVSCFYFQPKIKQTQPWRKVNYLAKGNAIRGGVINKILTHAEKQPDIGRSFFLLSSCTARFV